MKKLIFIFALATIFTFIVGLSYAQQIINGPDWELGQVTYNNQKLVLDMNGVMSIIGIVNIPLIMHTESEDNGIYTVTGVNQNCTVNPFVRCNIVETGWYSDIYLDPTASYVDMTGTPWPFNGPDDITPIRIKVNSTPYMNQVWELYDYPYPSTNEWMDLATSRRTYRLVYEIEFQCTPSQGEWDLTITDPTLSCNQSEYGQWKQMGSGAMDADVELLLTDPLKPLPLCFPISDNREDCLLDSIPMQASGTIYLPLQVFQGNPIDIYGLKHYNFAMIYTDGDITIPEPVHGDCVNDEQVRMLGTVTNIYDPNDVVTFEQWYSEGLKYLSRQTMAGINVNFDDWPIPGVLHVYGNIAFSNMEGTVTNSADTRGIYTNPSPMCKEQPVDFHNKFFIMGPDNGAYPATYGFYMINVPPGYNGPYTRTETLGCGTYDKISFHADYVPPQAPNPLRVYHGVLYGMIFDTDMYQIVDLPVSDCP